jgi:hypothetical protein
LWYLKIIQADLAWDITKGFTPKSCNYWLWLWSYASWFTH